MSMHSILLAKANGTARQSLLACAALALLLAPGAGLADHSTVHIRSGHCHLFTPEEETIGVDDTVIFYNHVEMTHTVVADDGAFESPPLAKDEAWSITFGKPGTYTYRLDQHPETKGRLRVVAE